MTGSINPANLFTKEDNDVKHFETLRDQMVMSREEFAHSSPSTDTLNKNNIHTINSNPDTLWGVLERELKDQDSEELTPLTNSKSLTQHKISKKSILKSSNYKDPNISKSNGCEYSKLEVACE